MRVLSTVYDNRIKANSVFCELSISEYLDLVKKGESNLEIQRKVVSGFKPYERLRADLVRGCVIPPPVLAIDIGDGPDLNKNLENLLNEVSKNEVYVIDGLQRTNAIFRAHDSISDPAEKEAFLKRIMRVEFWIGISMPALTYRMILLNAGQKPMSLKHQLEVLTAPLCDQIEALRPDKFSFYREKDIERRSKPGEYQFSLISSAFQAFLQKKPHLDLRNEVIEELSQIEILDSYGESLNDARNEGEISSPLDTFVEYLDFLYDFDVLLIDKYPSRVPNPEARAVIPSGINFLSRDTVHLGMAAAYAWCRHVEPDALRPSCERLLTILKESETGSDPLDLEIFEKLQQGFRRKDNVGEQSRGLVFGGFREFFRRKGNSTLRECWVNAN